MAHTPEAAITFRVTLRDPVTGVDTVHFSDFQAVGDGAPTINSVTTSDNTVFYVKLTNLPTRGIVGLNVIDNNTILDADGTRWAARRWAIGSYTAGDQYAVDQTVYPLGAAIPLPTEVGFQRSQLVLNATATVTAIRHTTRFSCQARPRPISPRPAPTIPAAVCRGRR